MTKIDQESTQWEDETKIEENKKQIQHQITLRTLSLKNHMKRKMQGQNKISQNDDFDRPKLSSRNKNLAKNEK